MAAVAEMCLAHIAVVLPRSYWEQVQVLEQMLEQMLEQELEQEMEQEQALVQEQVHTAVEAVQHLSVSTTQDYRHSPRTPCASRSHRCGQYTLGFRKSHQPRFCLPCGHTSAQRQPIFSK
jgi:hypothetical protein